MKKILLTALLGLTLSGGAHAQTDSYYLRSGDQLSIVVEQQPSISTAITQNGTVTPYVVRPDGKLSFPMVGDINTKGKTAEDLEAELRGSLSRYIIDPKVSVNIVKLGTVRVFVFGEVNKPGAYELTKNHTVIDAIGAAAGFNWDTAKKKVYLIRRGQTDSLIKLNLNHMLQTGDMRENYEMQEGDILYFTRNSRITFSRDIAPIFSAVYSISSAKKNFNE